MSDLDLVEPERDRLRQAINTLAGLDQRIDRVGRRLRLLETGGE